MVHDGYEAHYTAKLWSLIPEVYRTRTPAGPGVPPALVGLVEALGRQAADIRRRIDRMWEDQSIETADAWAIEEVAELLGTHAIAVLGPRERRVDVANTIHYRRRRGTPLVLEAIADDLTEWDSTVVESFATLLRTMHLLDPAPTSIAGSLWRGRLSGVSRGGLADLRRPAAAEQVDGPFDEFGHLVDVRRQQGEQGRHRIDGVNIHLWRARVLEVTGSDPVKVGPRTWTVDPSGRDVRLYAAGRDQSTRRQQITARRTPAVGLPSTGTPAPWEVPGPISCNLLDHQEYVVTAAHIRGLTPAPNAAQRTALESLIGRHFVDRTSLVQHLVSAGVVDPAAAPWYRNLLDAALLPASAKSVLYPGSVELIGPGGADHRFRQARVQAAHLGDLTGPPAPLDAGVTGLIDPLRGRVAIVPATTATPEVMRYHYAVPHPVGAGTDEWGPTTATGPVVTGGGAVVVGPGTTRLGDNRTYHATVAPTPTSETILAAASGRRPYVLVDDGSAPGAHLIPASSSASFVAEGVWLGADTAADLVVGSSAGGINPDWTSVTIRHATLDPGGVRSDGTPIGALRLVVDGDVDRLVIDRCILGQVVINGTVGSMLLCDTIIDARSPAADAITAPHSTITMHRVTALGRVTCNLLRATDSLIAGHLSVSNTQAGCFRFGAADGDSRFPPRYRTWPEPGDTHAVDVGFFSSTRLGDDDYLDLHPSAPAALRLGSERGEQMGAYESRRLHAKTVGLNAKLTEYAPARVSIGLFEES